DQIYFRLDQLGRELWKSLVLPFGEPVVDDNVPTLDVTMLAESLQKAFDQEGPAVAGADGEKTNPRNLRSRFFGPFATEQQTAGDQGQGKSYEPTRSMAEHVHVDRLRLVNASQRSEVSCRERARGLLHWEVMGPFAGATKPNQHFKRVLGAPAPHGQGLGPCPFDRTCRWPG